MITGLAGEDFVYNDAAYSTEYGYNLLISPAQLQRAWAASSVPRHAMAIGFGDSLRPLPIVPRRLTAESLAVVEPSDEIQAVAEAPIRINRGPAAERLREQTLDLLGARTMLVDGEPLGPTARAAPPTRLDPREVAVHERPIESALTTSYERAFDVTASDGADESDTIADARDATLDASTVSSDTLQVPPAAEQADVKDPGSAGRIPPIGLALMGLAILLMLGGGLAGWRRREPQLQAAMLPAWVAGWWQRGRRTVTTFNWRGWRNRMPAPVTLPSLSALADRLPRRR